MIIRLLYLPFMALGLFAVCVAHLIVWLLDPTYDHKAALSLYSFMEREPEPQSRRRQALNR